MSGNSLGTIFTITTFGESHGASIGVVIDGMPANIEIKKENLQAFVNRRKSQMVWETARIEEDFVEILSGIKNGKTLGTPICVVVKNSRYNDKEYAHHKVDRIGHADKIAKEKYKNLDHVGGGRFSARETVSRVIAGYFAKELLGKTKVLSKIISIGEYDVKNTFLSMKSFKDSEDAFLLFKKSEKEDIEKYLTQLKEESNSIGGEIGIVIKKCPKYLGAPVFSKLKADLAKALMSISGAMSFSLGFGEKYAQKTGKELVLDEANFFGMNGGITTGEDIKVRVTFKAPSSVGDWAKKGRHDACYLLRALVVCESMVYITLADHFLWQKIYEN